MRLSQGMKRIVSLLNVSWHWQVTDPLPGRCWCSVDWEANKARIGVKGPRLRFTTLWEWLYYCPWWITVHGWQLAKWIMPASRGGWIRWMNFIRIKEHEHTSTQTGYIFFNMTSNAFILVSLGTLASPPLLLALILKRALFMHQPFLFFVITLCS